MPVKNPHRFFVTLILTGIILALTMTSTAHAQEAHDVVVGVDIPGVGRMSSDEQDKLLSELHAAGVHVIRTWIGTDMSYEFIKKACALSIKVELTLSVVSPPNAPKRAMVADMPWMFGGAPLSTADAELTKSTFQTQLNKLEAMGIELVAFELGNEFNNPSFNGEFPIHPNGECAKCGNMGLDYLEHDPEGQKIAAGFRNYVKLLAAVKNVRDHSRLNRHTPVLLGGLADNGAEAISPGARTNQVSIKATIEYLRENGLDNVVDAYGIHTYPSPSGQPGAAAARRKSLEDTALSECRPEGQGKPCWITEWGVENKDDSCPPNDSNRASLVRELMADDFRPYVQQKRIVGLLYYVWERNPGAKREEPFSLYRCGTLTPSGKLAIDASLLH